jgi:hypothetical protein
MSRPLPEDAIATANACERKASQHYMSPFIGTTEISKEKVEYLDDLRSLKDRHQVESVNFYLGPIRYLAGYIIRYLDHTAILCGFCRHWANGQARRSDGQRSSLPWSGRGMGARLWTLLACAAF